jgi:hypothetical protein
MTRRGERGQAGGMEVLPFGLLVFVAGTLVLVNIWGVVDSRFAADAAAREAARWVVESASRATTPEQVRAGATEVARATMADHGRPGALHVRIDPPDATFVRCERVRVTVFAEVPVIRLPFLGGFTRGFEVRATRSEIVDPSRAGVAGTATCLR